MLYSLLEFYLVDGELRQSGMKDWLQDADSYKIIMKANVNEYASYVCLDSICLTDIRSL